MIRNQLQVLGLHQYTDSLLKCLNTRFEERLALDIPGRGDKTRVGHYVQNGTERNGCQESAHYQ